ncbi:MAG TPA: hypothetical protein VF767_01330 [Bryobacteraceae bacterium]
MKRRSFALIALATLFAVPLPAADEAPPTVDQILNKYLQAAGGKEAIEKITTRVMKGEIDVVTFSTKGPFERITKEPDLQVTTSEFEGFGKVIQCYDGHTAWVSEPERGMREITGPERDLMRRQADLHGPLHLKSQYKSIVAKGKSKIGERDAWLLECQPEEGSVEKLYFDVESGLLTGLEVQTPQNTAMKVLLEDYKAVDGIMLPFTIRQESPELSLVVRTSEVTHNVPVDDAKFAKPSK